jgi:hypothetical protein
MIEGWYEEDRRIKRLASNFEELLGKKFRGHHYFF